MASTAARFLLLTVEQNSIAIGTLGQSLVETNKAAKFVIFLALQREEDQREV